MWDKLTTRKFIQLYDIETNANLFLIEKQVKMLSVIEGKDESEYDNIKYGKLIELLNDKTSFYDHMPQTKPVDIIESNGKQYRFIHQVEKITAGQFIDISHFGGNMLELHNAIACMVRPMKNGKVLKYGSVPHNEVAEDMLDAKFIDVHGCIVFFYHLLMEFTKHTINYLEVTKKNKEMLTNLVNDGVGLHQLN